MLSEDAKIESMNLVRKRGGGEAKTKVSGDLETTMFNSAGFGLGIELYGSKNV